MTLAICSRLDGADRVGAGGVNPEILCRRVNPVTNVRERSPARYSARLPSTHGRVGRDVWTLRIGRDAASRCMEYVDAVRERGSWRCRCVPSVNLRVSTVQHTLPAGWRNSRLVVQSTKREAVREGAKEEWDRVGGGGDACCVCTVAIWKIICHARGGPRQNLHPTTRSSHRVRVEPLHQRFRAVEGVFGFGSGFRCLVQGGTRRRERALECLVYTRTA